METEEPMDLDDQVYDYDYDQELRQALENIPDDWMFPSELDILSQNNYYNEDPLPDPHNNLETPEFQNIDILDPPRLDAQPQPVPQQPGAPIYNINIHLPQPGIADNNPQPLEIANPQEIAALPQQVEQHPILDIDPFNRARYELIDYILSNQNRNVMIINTRQFRPEIRNDLHAQLEVPPELDWQIAIDPSKFNIANLAKLTEADPDLGYCSGDEQEE